MLAERSAPMGGLRAIRLRGADYCCSKVKRPLEAKACHAVSAKADAADVLLYCATCLTPWVSK